MLKFAIFVLGAFSSLSLDLRRLKDEWLLTLGKVVAVIIGTVALGTFYVWVKSEFLWGKDELELVDFWGFLLVGYVLAVVVFFKRLALPLGESDLIIPMIVIWSVSITSFCDTGSAGWGILMVLLFPGSIFTSYHLLLLQKTTQNARAFLNLCYLTFTLIYGLLLIFRFGIFEMIRDHEVKNLGDAAQFFFLGMVMSHYLLAFAFIASFSPDRGEQTSDYKTRVRRQFRCLGDRFSEAQLPLKATLLIAGLNVAVIWLNYAYYWVSEIILLNAIYAVEPVVIGLALRLFNEVHLQRSD